MLTACVVAATAGAASAAPMVVLFGSPSTNRQIVRPGTAQALPLDGRLYVQEPNLGHLFAGDRDRPYRLSGVHADALLRLRSGTSMASLLKSRIDQARCVFPPYGDAGCGSHLLFVNEVDYHFAERAPNLNTPAWRGRTSRNQPRRIYPNYVPRPKAGQPGYELSRAMLILAGIPYPGGGTYADRVHFYVAPGVVTSLGVGRGRYHNLGRDRRPHFRSYEGVRAALQLAGGLWLEMYHFNRTTRTRYPFNTYEWSVYPWRFSQLVTAPGATAPTPAVAARIHFLMTRGMPRNKGGAPPQCANPATPQACQFTLASSPKNATFLGNGVGQYRMEGNESEWGVYVRSLFFR